MPGCRPSGVAYEEGVRACRPPSAVSRSGGGWPQVTSSSQPRGSNSANKAVTKSSSPAASVTDRSTTRAISVSDKPRWEQASRKLVVAMLARRTAGSPFPRVSPMSQRVRPPSETTSRMSPPTRASAAAET